MSEKMVVFGAGQLGSLAVSILKARGKDIVAIVDNDTKKHGKQLKGVSIIGMDEYARKYGDISIVVALNAKNVEAVQSQLSGYRYSVFAANDYCPGKTLISYSDPRQKEDIILYHVLNEIEGVFYIDVGSNDPVDGSVTKMLYDEISACGINIEPQIDLYDKTVQERVRDINVNCGVGAEKGQLELYVQGGLSTFVKSNVREGICESTILMEVRTLKDICEEYIEEERYIHFLKIDVEGFEKNVLLGADFKLWRPWILVIESTIPGTGIPSYNEWEGILLENGYHFVYEYGVNRYYVADERKDLDCKFTEMDIMLGANTYYCLSRVYE